MTDLHGWITQQVDASEAVARRAADCATAQRWEALGSLVVAVPDENTAGPDIIEAVFHAYDDALVHAAIHDPAAVLRRCTADRKILAAHPTTRDVIAVKPDGLHGFGCATCHQDEGMTVGHGWCATLLALAEGYGWEAP